MNDRELAIDWAREILTTDFVVLDTETTGLNNDDVIVQIGVVGKEGNVLLDSLIKPYKPIPPEATSIHGITNEMVSEAPTILELEPRLRELMSGRLTLIYNQSFDWKMLIQSFHHNGQSVGLNLAAKDYRDNHWLWVETTLDDVMQRFAIFYGDWNDYYQSYTWKKLSFAAGYFGIDTKGAHGAVADALMTLRIVEGMANSK